MGKVKRVVCVWGPALAWMGMIFYLSSRQSVSITHTFFYDFLIFKLLHMIEYAILYFFIFRGLYLYRLRNSTVQEKLLYGAIISILYALSDEIHQTFVSTREGRMRDVLIDAAGIILMYLYLKNNVQSIKKFF